MNTGNLDRLRTMTEDLPLLEDMVRNHNCNHNVTEYHVEDGLCVGIGLYYTPEVSIQRAIASKGMVFKNHQHQEHEYLIVYAGRLHVHLVRGDNFIDIIIGPGESAHILPKEEHWVKALETTHMVGITVPASEGYPRA